MNVKSELEYYLDRKVSSEEIEDAANWVADNPGVSLSEYVDAMIEIGAL